MDDRPEAGRRLDAVYVVVRDGAAVDREVAFDVAMNELEYVPLHAEAASWPGRAWRMMMRPGWRRRQRRSWSPSGTRWGSSWRQSGSRGWSGRWTLCGPTYGRPA